MSYPPKVEALRPLVQKYFPANLVDKALYVINLESGGDPSARGDNGVAIGLFQIQDRTAFPNRPDSTWLSNPENNIKYAAQVLGAANGNWAPWGENNSYNGQPFGALGNNPYNGMAAATSDVQPRGGGNQMAPTPQPGKAIPMPLFGKDSYFLNGVGLVKSIGNNQFQKDGQVYDQWGNRWNSTTGKWYNSQGQSWLGTDAGTGVGRWGENDTIPPGGTSGGGGANNPNIDWAAIAPGSGPPPSYYATTAANDTIRTGNTVSHTIWQQKFDEANENRRRLESDRDYALAIGDLDLARQKQTSVDYWAGKELEARQSMNTQDNQTSIATTQINARSQLQQAAMSAEASRYAAQTRLQEGLANAHNDQERNRVLLAHEQELASISRMEDETKRNIASQENQIKGFDAETTRAAQMGDIALKNNQFLLDASTSPRDLFGLYMMQRGIAPDWSTMLAGGKPAQGDALAPVNPMTAYKPTGVLPTNWNIGNSQVGQVGQASRIGLASNPFLNMNQVTAPTFNTNLDTTGITMPNFTPVASGAPPMVTPTPVDINPGGAVGGIPAGALRPGMNLSTVGSDIMGSDINTGTGYYDQGRTRRIQPGDSIARGTQVWLDYGEAPRMAFGTQIPRFAGGTDQLSEGFGPNYTAAGAAGTGQQDPLSFGATAMYDFGVAPDPTLMKQKDSGVAPQFGQPRNDGPGYTAQPISTFNFTDFGVKNQQFPAAPSTTAPPVYQSFIPQNTQVPPNLGFTTAPKMMTGDAPAANPNAGGALPEIIHNPTRAPIAIQPNPQTQNSFYNQQGQIDPRFLQMLLDRIRFQQQRSNWGQGPGWNIQDMNDLGNIIPRYALGTDASQQYSQAGLGQLYLQSSSNPHLTGQQMAPGIQTLMDYGVPISPALAASTSGQTLPTLNTASAFTSRGGGVLPSLQTFGKQTKGETENFQGYAQGVIGMPWSDIVDYLGMPTQNLGQAKRAQTGMF